ncbi:6-pyruvoyl tetrahydropterin synthase family protein [Dactylosporangium cerinum]|uniref:6-carboxy-5,6,7,8-tetrahydropterin synthase n=1 Tax=Dactylosporangium cerinum TaxID=1434730 RepID=A0ABV9W718_9ACTN
MYTIGKRFGFSAAHHLPGLPDGHKCGRHHGHNFSVEVVLGADALVPPGFVRDFGELGPFRDAALDVREQQDDAGAL